MRTRSIGTQFTLESSLKFAIQTVGRDRRGRNICSGVGVILRPNYTSRRGGCRAFRSLRPSMRLASTRVWAYRYDE